MSFNLVRDVVNLVIKGPGEEKIHVSPWIYTVRFKLMVWISGILALALLWEEYFDRRIFCHGATNYTERPLDHMGDYCLKHGHFDRKTCASTFTPWNFFVEAFTMHSFIYFIVKGLVFAIPSFIWRAVKKKAKSYIEGMQTAVRILQESYEELDTALYVRDSEKCNKKLVYTVEGTSGPCTVSREGDEQVSSNINLKISQPVNRDYKAKLERVVAKTKDFQSIFHKQFHNIAPTLRFYVGRAAWDLTLTSLFLVCDVGLAVHTLCFKEYGFTCPLPNADTVTCIVKVMVLKRYVFIFACVATSAILLMEIFHLFSTLWMLCAQKPELAHFIPLLLTEKKPYNSFRFHYLSYLLYKNHHLYRRVVYLDYLARRVLEKVEKVDRNDGMCVLLACSDSIPSLVDMKVGLDKKFDTREGAATGDVIALSRFCGNQDELAPLAHEETSIDEMEHGQNTNNNDAKTTGSTASLTDPRLKVANDMKKFKAKDFLNREEYKMQARQSNYSSKITLKGILKPKDTPSGGTEPWELTRLTSHNPYSQMDV